MRSQTLEILTHAGGFAAAVCVFSSHFRLAVLRNLSPWTLLCAHRLASSALLLCLQTGELPLFSHASAGQIQDCQSAVAMNPPNARTQERVRVQLNPASGARNHGLILPACTRTIASLLKANKQTVLTVCESWTKHLSISFTLGSSSFIRESITCDVKYNRELVTHPHTTSI